MTRFLDKIDSPDDIKELTMNELVVLAQEIREYVIEVITQTGGHLASSLGAVELTLALHRVFDSPRDVITWDVGHQTYIHKILTGRREQLKTIRQQGGLAGFQSRSESRYDNFGAGHASTSISAALGFARARDLLQEDNHVIAVIGDGAMTGGLAFEALNNAGRSGTDILVILNDNEMSISRNVGAVSTYFTEISTNPLFNRIRDQIWDLAGKLPVGARTVREFGHKLEESVKTLIQPGVMFDELGFKYYGPVNGHSLSDLETVLTRMKGIQGPKLLHIKTVKGRGWKQSESDPIGYHGVSGKPKIPAPDNGSKLPSFNTVFTDTLIDLARSDPRIVAITAAMAEGTGLVRFAAELPERFFDVGIAEGHAVTFAAGLAAAGMKPVVCIYSTFLQRAYDQILHDVDLQGLPVIFALDRAGLVGQDGATHQGAFDLVYLSSVPGMTISAPRDGNELRNLLFTAINEELTGPFAIRYPKDSIIRLDAEINYQPLTIGSWEQLLQGAEVALLAVGPLVEETLRAAALLRDQGVNPTVVNCRFIKPFDRELLASLVGNKLIVTLEEGNIINGFGTMIADCLYSQLGFQGRLRKLGIRDLHVPHATRGEQINAVGMDAAGIAREVITGLAE